MDDFSYPGLVNVYGVPPSENNMVSPALPPLIGFEAICIPLVGKVFVFPILQSPHDVAVIFRTCQLHTAWELLHESGGSEHLTACHAITKPPLLQRSRLTGGGSPNLVCLVERKSL